MLQIKSFSKGLVLDRIVIPLDADKSLIYVGVLFHFIFILPLFGNAQKYRWKDGNSKNYSYRYVEGDPVKTRIYTLNNGLTVLLSVNKKEPRIQTLIGVRTGSNNDPKDHTGLAHYLEHLLFKGTFQYGSLDSAKEKPYLDEIENLYDTYNHSTDPQQRKAIYHIIDSVSGLAAMFAIANEYDKLMAAMGAQGTNAHTSMEETVYEEDIPSNAVDKFLAVQAERFRNPVFRLFHTELEAVYEEKNRGLDNDGWKINETLMAALFPTHNYGQQTTIGSVEHLKNPSLKAIRKFYNTYYVPNNMGIVMSGDFDPDEMIKKIDAAFSWMVPKPFESYQPSPETKLKEPITKEVTGPDAESVVIGFRLPGAQDSVSSLTATVISQLLSNGKAGLIDLDLNRKQLVLGAGAGLDQMKDYSVFRLTGKAKAGQPLEEVKGLLLSELEKLKRGDFDETLVIAIFNNFKLLDLQGMEKNSSRAGSLMDGFIKHRGERYLSDVAFVDDMAKITREQIIKFANTYLDTNYVVVYKRKGVDSSTVKVEKPSITPVEVNREAQSPFLRKIMSMHATPVKPQWLNYEKDIQKSKLGNADLLYTHNSNNGIFHLYYQFEMGSWNNLLLPLAATYLQFLSSDKYSSEEISRQFYNIACNYSINPGTDVTTISITGLQENFDKAMELFEDILHHCKPDEEALASLKIRIQKQRSDSKLNKANIMRGLTQYAIYGKNNPFNYQLGNDKLNQVTASKLTRLLHELLSYKHTIIYYGPQKLPALTTTLLRLHKLPVNYKPFPVAAKFEKVQQLQNQVLFTGYDMVQAEVQWVRNGEGYTPALTPVINVFNNYFGGGMGSIVFQTIRESKALAYSTYAYYVTPNKKEDRYTAIAYVGSQADKMKEGISGMNALLQDMPTSEKTFETAKQSLKQNIETERVDGDGIIFSYLAAKRMGLAIDYRKTLYNNIDKIKLSDIRRFHDVALKGKTYSFCVMASDKKIDKNDLKAYGQVKTLTPEEIFGY